MARNPYPGAMQAVWRDQIEKESRARLLSYKKLKDEPRFTSKLEETLRNRIMGAVPSKANLPPISITKLPDYKRTKTDWNHPPKYDEITFTEEDLLDNQKEVNPLVRKTLYTGIARLDEGRRMYLNQRNTVIPEKRFVFPMCATMEYGWRLQPRDAQPPAFPMSRTDIHCPRSTL